MKKQRLPHEQQMALECVRLVLNTMQAAGPASQVVKSAETLLAFVLNDTDRSPREIIEAALDQANVR